MLDKRFASLCGVAGGILLGFMLEGAGPACAETLVSPWVEGFNNKVRLIGGKAQVANASRRVAGVEISMPPGWKTYWYAPGEAGGIPPEFDWSGTENATVSVRFPVPHRLLDKAGASIGYKDHVIFPVMIAPADDGKPVRLKLKVSFGACKDICIPAEADLALDIPTDAPLSAELVDALAKVPQVATCGGDAMAEIPNAKKDPWLKSCRIDASAEKPMLILEVQDPGGSGGDAFVTVADGTYLPLPKKVSDDNGKSVYEVDLTDGVDIKDLTGKVITATLAGTTGQSAFLITVPKEAAQK
jgi:DsbC/DsbD-like thiol-disulfide interchange protein